MNQELFLLLISAASLGFLHTALGPDHYLPFVVISKASNWSPTKTILITTLCGLGHIAGSLLIGVMGVFLGVSLQRLELLESFRGGLAAWILIAFGLLYCAWGLKQAMRRIPHTHWHHHEDGTLHKHKHTHQAMHAHAHDLRGQVPTAGISLSQDSGGNSDSLAGNIPRLVPDPLNLTPWVLFTIFVFGPCEVLIPLSLYPAIQLDIFGTILVILVFSLTTILTMLGFVLILSFGLKARALKGLERYSHALAGATICFCGLGIQFLGF